MFAFSIFSFILFIRSLALSASAVHVCMSVFDAVESHACVGMVMMWCESFVCSTRSTHFISIRSVFATGSFFCVVLLSFIDLIHFVANEIFDLNIFRLNRNYFCLYNEFWSVCFILWSLRCYMWEFSVILWW